MIIAIIIIAFSLLFLLFSISSKPRKVYSIYFKQLALPAVCIAFIICLILFSKTAVDSAFKGINLWLTVVFPSLFPFFVGSALLNETGFVRAIGVLLEPIMRPIFNVPGCGSFALAMGITSGYPVGANITSKMRKNESLTKTEAERLLAFTNNSGPLFIIGAVAVGMFKQPELGLFIWICHILACLTVGFVFRFYGKKERIKKQCYGKGQIKRFKQELLSNEPRKSIGLVFGEAVRSSVTNMLAIGGFIILFSVVINLLLETGIIGFVSGALATLLSPMGIDKGIVTSVVSGIFEITTGTSMASWSSNAGLVQQLTAASLVIGWAGLSVHAQVLSIISDTDIDIRPYLLGKGLQGVFAAVYTFIGCKSIGTFLVGSKAVFSPVQPQKLLVWHDYFLMSFHYLLAAIILLVSFAIISMVIYYILPQRKYRYKHR